MKRLIPLLVVVLLAACGQPTTSSPTTPPVQTPGSGVSSSPPAASAEPTAALADAKILVVMTHDSFSVSKDVLAAFERQAGITVQVLKSGDAGAALNRAILSKASPLADVFFGVDNTFLSRALAADIFLPYESPAIPSIPSDLRIDSSGRLLPVDYGYVTINYDKAALKQVGLTPPTTLEDLTKPAWKGKLVVENPTTSSPGLAFLLATVAHFGEAGTYTWKDYWRDLRANEVFVSNDWTDAYYTQFSGSSGKGPYPLVVSYATSPAAEVYFSEGKLTVPPTDNLQIPGGSFRQVEFVGILKGTQKEALARQFVDFMLGPQFQADIPLQMFVYPTMPSAPLPEVFTKFAEVPAQPADFTPTQIEAGREGWIKGWTEIVLR